MTFSGHSFHALGALSRSVPVLSCGSLAKRWLVPGWRLGWVLVHNKDSVLSDSVYSSLGKLATLVLGPCSLIQAALPRILAVPQSWHDDVMRHIETTALVCYSALQSAPGLTPIKPQVQLLALCCHIPCMSVGGDVHHGRGRLLKVPFCSEPRGICATSLQGNLCQAPAWLCKCCCCCCQVFIQAKISVRLDQCFLTILDFRTPSAFKINSRTPW